MALGGNGGGGASAGGVRAGRAFVELGVRDSLSGELTKIKAKFLAVGKTLAAIGAGAFGVAGSVVGAGAGLFASLLPGIQDLARLDATRKAFGLTAEAATGLFGVFAQNGVEMDAAIGSVEHFGKAVNDAVMGHGNTDLFRDLNTSAGEFYQLKPDEQFYRLHDALMAVSDPAKRVQLLMQAMGEDAGKKLVGTLALTTAELRDQSGAFRMSEDQLAAATRANREYNRATAAVGKAWQLAAVEAAPAIEAVGNAFANLLAPIKTAQGAGELAAASVDVAWSNAVLKLTEGWVGFKDLFVNDWHDTTFVVESLWLDMGAAIERGWVDSLAFIRNKFGETVNGIVNQLGQIPGIGKYFLGAGVVLDVAGGNPAAFKKQIDDQLAAAQKQLADAKSAADDARKAGRADELKAAQQQVAAATVWLANIVAAGKTTAALGDKLSKGASQLTQAAGYFGVASGFMSGAFGTRSISPQVTEQKKTNVLLGEILGAVAAQVGPRFA